MINPTITLPGYHILEFIYSSSHTFVYRGQRDIDQEPVVIKFLRSEYPTFSEMVQFRNQYSIAKNLDFPGIVKPYSLETYRNGYALVMEDFGGISLQQWLQHNVLDVYEFLSIAVQIVSILDRLHHQRIIHKDIKPANILIHPKTKEIRLIDFSIASLLPRENQEIQNPQVLEGTLSYLSPEQTGRMNRGIDYRSDFYSLGVTFFELITGELPFISNDPMELVHCHIAKQPDQFKIHNSQFKNEQLVPQVLGDIVIKLMAKNAEDRYQSALGLKHDLLLCWNQLRETSIIGNFSLGTRDVCDRFIIPEKLYGREVEVQTLLAAFERVAQGKTEIILVAGFSGIGKTCVVNEIHKPIVRQHGYFIKGKFDQFQRNIPLSAFVQSLRNFMGQILSENNIQIARWHDQLLQALGDNGQVIIDVIPELEHIIGKQPPVPALSGISAQIRFNFLFLKFIQVFTTPEHPLVVFLDDLQWADSASLTLIQLLMSEVDQGYLLLIGAYRDNEVSLVHPLILTLNEIEKIGYTINIITLNSLQLTDLNYLVADTLTCSLELAQRLTDLIYQKTQGNPFFTNQFLQSLYKDGIIKFDFDIGYWQSDIAQVKLLTLNDDVVEFMAQQLQKLPSATQEILKLAACIGNQFDLNTLAIIYEKSLLETASDLWEALRDGLILPQNEIYKFYQNDEPSETGDSNLGNEQYYHFPTYKFLHDRVQQAAYLLIPEGDKQATHLRIGNLLLANSPFETTEENIFEIVNQLNYGLELTIQQSQKDELAKLNLIAGRKAQTATAYVAASQYFTTGIELLAPDTWQTQYQLTLELYNAATEAAYLSTVFAEVERLAAIVLQQTDKFLDKAKIYEIKIQVCIAKNQLSEAVEIGLKVLKLLGIEFPLQPNQEDIISGLQTTQKLWEGIKITDILDLPVMTDSDKLVAMQILINISAASYVTSPSLYILIVFQEINLSVKYGNTAASTYAYAAYGLILCGIVGNISLGYQFGQLALNLLQKLNAKALQAKVYFLVNCFIKHWQDHLRTTIEPLKDAYFSGIETGDLEFASYSAFKKSVHLYFAGEDLSVVEQDVNLFMEGVRKIKRSNTINYYQTLYQAVKYLRQSSKKDSVKLELPEDIKDINAGYFYCHEMIICYLFNRNCEAVVSTAFAEKYLEGMTALFFVPVFHFYDSLIKLAIYIDATPDEQAEIILKVKLNQQKMQNWADNAPMNYLHKFALVEAEKYRVLGEHTLAIEYYDRAIAAAQENQYLQEEALANELAAKFYLGWGKEKIAQVYLIDAYYAYARWGATAKIHDLEQRYPQLLSKLLYQETIEENLASLTMTNKTVVATKASGSTFLEGITVMQAYQALSSEIELDKLLSTLMQVVITNSGAQRGILLLLHQGNLVVEATGDIASEKIQVLQSTPLANFPDIPHAVINYVQRTQQTLVIHNIASDTRFAHDTYIINYQPQSVLCTPILKQGKLISIVYLENQLTSGAFTRDRLELLNLLCSQAAICLENARLYQQSQESLENLQQMQLQLVQSEKMSALGNLVAGVAHEINNPVGFIGGNLQPAMDYVKDLLHIIDVYQKYYPNPIAEVVQEIEAVDLDYIRADLPKLISSMREGVQRIRNISTSLRTFSRSDSDRPVSCNLHDGIDSTLLILKHRLKACDARPDIQIIKDYGNLPAIECFSGQLNQVFMNLLANAIDALEEANSSRSLDEIKANAPKITIQTQISTDKNYVLIRIKDNGMGMTEAIQQKIFDHLFTTKPVGQGTGLGLSIARQIIVEKHQGTLKVNSVFGDGSEFIISLPIKAKFVG
ncbi:trifunctional serine/threonine-protein kinase/ATP-binding protein/sensor histidine kinase [Anabaena subtropica]|uniref:histidine kinase n=1 Tax=Anabaena subtropica FACHB-260 TaxID=2692884 RepID=A0ABR8CQW6_9NOST|nr:ATP-binding sensor histidine kinase [Anabaena subtropica]MBD2345176.1 AAA family ATPase [Anabaena subtropica FACHB-260]